MWTQSDSWQEALDLVGPGFRGIRNPWEVASELALHTAREFPRLVDVVDGEVRLPVPGVKQQRLYISFSAFLPKDPGTD